MYCEIINTNDTNNSIVTLWNIEENKYIDIHTLGKPTKVYTKYKNIFDYQIFPVNYTGKILSLFYEIKIITPLLKGKKDGNVYYIEKNLCIEKYDMGK